MPRLQSSWCQVARSSRCVALKRRLSDTVYRQPWILDTLNPAVERESEMILRYGPQALHR
jgi:hypothetical protein